MSHARALRHSPDLNGPLPDETAGRDFLDAGDDAAAMEDHRIEQVGDHAGVVRDDEELLADLRAGAGAIREVDDAVFFREAGDPRLGITDDQAVVAEALEIRGQRL